MDVSDTTELANKYFGTGDLIEASEVWRKTSYSKIDSLSASQNFNLLRELISVKEEYSFTPEEQFRLFKQTQVSEREKPEETENFKKSKLVQELAEANTKLSFLSTELKACRLVQESGIGDFEEILNSFVESEMKSKLENLESFLTFERINHETSKNNAQKFKLLLKEEQDKKATVSKAYQHDYEYWSKIEKDHVSRVKSIYNKHLEKYRTQFNLLKKEHGENNGKLQKSQAEQNEEILKLSLKVREEIQTKIQLGKLVESEKEKYEGIISNLQGKISELTHLTENYNGVVGKIEHEIKGKDKHIDELKEYIKDHETIIENQKEKIMKLEEMNCFLNNENTEHRNTIETQLEELTQLKNENSEFKNKTINLQGKLNSSEQSLKFKEEELKHFNKLQEEIQIKNIHSGETEVLKFELETYKNMLEKSQLRNEEFVKEAKEYKQKCEDLEKKIQALNEELEKISAIHSKEKEDITQDFYDQIYDLKLKNEVSLESIVKQTNKERTNLETNLRTITQDKNELQNQIDEISRELKEKNEEINHLTHKFESGKDEQQRKISIFNDKFNEFEMQFSNLVNSQNTLHENIKKHFEDWALKTKSKIPSQKLEIIDYFNKIIENSLKSHKTLQIIGREETDLYDLSLKLDRLEKENVELNEAVKNYQKLIEMYNENAEKASKSDSQLKALHNINKNLEQQKQILRNQVSKTVKDNRKLNLSYLKMKEKLEKTKESLKTWTKCFISLSNSLQLESVNVASPHSISQKISEFINAVSQKQLKKVKTEKQVKVIYKIPKDKLKSHRATIKELESQIDSLKSEIQSISHTKELRAKEALEEGKRLGYLQGKEEQYEEYENENKLLQSLLKEYKSSKDHLQNQLQNIQSTVSVRSMAMSSFDEDIFK